MTTAILGLSKSIQDPDTQAVAERHVLGRYSVDLVNKQTRADFLAFLSPTAKTPVFRSTVSIPGTPEGEGGRWIYEQLLAQQNQTEANIFAGAQPVLEADPAAGEAA